MIAALLIGAESMALAHGPVAQAPVQAEPATVNADKVVALGEAAVAKAPQDAALRAALGHAYLRAGRFEAAASALNDALALGDGSGRTTLGLALAQIACGHNRAALATLDRGGANVVPTDFGLALALAGDTERGVAVLTDSVRDGHATPNLRENLAYAYALAGRWADARLTAGFDLSPDQVEVRLEQWAQSMQSGGERVRIARLLNVPATVDQAMPIALALNGSGAALAPTPMLATATTDVSGELPAIAATPAVAVAESIAPTATSLPTYVPVAAWRSAARRPVFHVHHAVNFDHVVQLGAFSSALGAERAKLILAKRNPQLRGHGFLITQANVNGRAYWRVTTWGFDVQTASLTCASLKHHGAPCFAYAIKPARQGNALALANTHGASYRRR